MEHYISVKAKRSKMVISATRRTRDEAMAAVVKLFMKQRKCYNNEAWIEILEHAVVNGMEAAMLDIGFTFTIEPV